MIANLLDGGDDDYRVRVQLHHPIIGIGAPAHLFLPQAAQLLGTEAILPPHADVANAIGAITSPVCIRHHLEISPTDSDSYYVAGLPDAPTYRNFEDAYRFSVEQLKTIVRERAKIAGTSQTRVEITVHDRIAAGDGACCSSVACSTCSTGPPRPHPIGLVSAFALRNNNSPDTTLLSSVGHPAVLASFLLVGFSGARDVSGLQHKNTPRLWRDRDVEKQPSS